MDNIKIPVWLIALTLFGLFGLTFYSLLVGKPFYINGEPWGFKSTIASDNTRNLTIEEEQRCENKCRVDLGSTTNRVCFITYYRHDPIGKGESVNIRNENNKWILVTETGGPYVEAKARCVVLN